MRPTLYKEEYCEKLIEHMAKGLPYETFAAEIGCCRATLYNWEKEHDEFLDAKKRGRDLGYKWWISEGMRGLWQDKEGPFLNNTVWIFAMKNMFNWRDNPEPEDDENEEYNLPDSLNPN